MNLQQDSEMVLIIADDPQSPRDLIAQWQQERTAPAFTVMSTELFPGAAAAEFDLVIVLPVSPGRFAAVMKTLGGKSHPVICIARNTNDADMIRDQHARPLVVKQDSAWIVTTVLVGSECLKRVDLASRLRRAEQAAAVHARQASLGRYMLENRHHFSNLMTSLLGNSELLLMENEKFPQESREQIQTVHEMALQIHEMLQRFSSMASEIKVHEKQSQDETRALSHAAFSTQ